MRLSRRRRRHAGADRDGLTAGPADRLQAVGGAIVALDSGLGHMSEQPDYNILIEPANAIEALIKDITGATKSAFIAASYASAACLTKLTTTLAGAAARGITLEVYVASPPRDDAKAIFAEMNVDYSVKAKGRLCAAVIDEETVWYGTIPLLAFPKKEDRSIRFKSNEVAAEFLSEIQQ